MRKHRNPQARLAKPPSPDNAPTSACEDAPTEVRACPARPFDIADEVNSLRWFIARASAMGRALEGSIEQPWGHTIDEDRRRLEDLSHLGGALVEALRAATEACDGLAARLTKLADDRLAAALSDRTGS